MIEWDYELIVYGDPKAQGRPRAVSRGKFTSVYESKKDKKNKQTLAVIAQQKSPTELLTCPLRVDIYFYFRRPKSHYGTGKNSKVLKNSAPTYYTKKPDRDNLDKMVLDALNGVFWLDDRQVCQGWLQKKYSERPSTEIYIKKL